MAEPLWYYGQDGRECGPISLARLAELVIAGTVKPTDLVWCEGMQDWTPAGSVQALITATSGAARVRPPFRASLFRAIGELLRPGSDAARALLICGITLVVIARGCDGLGQRNVARLAAKQAAARQQFDDAWETKRLEFQQSIDTLSSPEGKATPTANDLKELARLRSELSGLPKQKAAAAKLAERDWRELEITAAKWNNAIWGYWRELLFVFGSLTFVVGLILVGFGGQGSERWISLAMLAIIAYSIYVGGAAWGVAVPGPAP